MGVMYYILSPFSWLLNFFYSFTDSYGISLILFALVIKIILFPLTIKGKKGMIQMNLLSGKMQQLQKQYGKDRERYNLEVQKLYEREHVNPMGGCLPMLLTMLVLFGFLGVVYYPVHYIFGVSNEAVKAACEAIGLATTNTSTMQTALIQAIHNGASIDPSIISASVVAEIQNFNTSFFGMDMCDVPGFHLTPIAIFPAIATVTMFVSYFITQKLSGMAA